MLIEGMVGIIESPAPLGNNAQQATAEVVRFDMMNYNNVEVKIAEIPITEDYLSGAVHFTIYGELFGNACTWQDVMYFSANNQSTETGSGNYVGVEVRTNDYALRLVETRIEKVIDNLHIFITAKFVDTDYYVVAPEKFYVDYTIDTMQPATVVVEGGTGAELPVGTEGQTLRYNSSNELEATSKIINKDDQILIKHRVEEDIDNWAESTMLFENSSTESFIVLKSSGETENLSNPRAELYITSEPTQATIQSNANNIYLLGSGNTNLPKIYIANYLFENNTEVGKYLRIKDNTGLVEFVDIDSLPNGTNEGDILVWDATLEKWVVVANSANLPDGVADGDILVWDATNSVWVVVANSANLPDGVADGDILVWDATLEDWKVSHLPETTAIPDGTAENDVLFWSEATQEWFPQQLPAQTGGTETVSNIKIANDIDYQVQIDIPNIYVPDTHFDIALKADVTYFIEYNIWFSGEVTGQRNRKITFGNAVQANSPLILNNKYGTVEIPNTETPDDVFMPLGNVQPSDLTDVGFVAIGTNFMRLRGHFKPTADMLLRVYWTSDVIDSWNIVKSSFAVWQEKYVPYETHSHNLADLTEKSYNSLDDKPTIPSTIFYTQTDLTIDGANGNYFLIEISANASFSLSNITTGTQYYFRIKNTSAGAITITLPNTADIRLTDTVVIWGVNSYREVAMMFDGTKRVWHYSEELI